LRADAEGADYLLAGNVFGSRTHPGEPAAGTVLVETICREVRVPVIAIGGITPQNAPECLRSGAAGVAVVSGIADAADPRAAAAEYWSAIQDRRADSHDRADGER
jgi:thiamine-phosphate diphosphorylase